MSSIGSNFKETNKSDYYQDLLAQSQKREMMEERQALIEKNKALESVLVYKNKQDQADKERMEKENKMKKEFVEENEKLLDKKKRMIQVKKHVQQQNDQEFIVKNNEELEKQLQEAMLKKSQLQNELLKGLNKQVSDKSKNRNSSQGKVEASALIVKDHECRYPCAKCHNKYPMNMLNSANIVFGKGKKY